MLRSDKLGSSLTWTNLEVLIDSKVTPRQPCALAARVASGCLGCLRLNIASRLREVICPLHSALVMPHVVQFWDPQCKVQISEVSLTEGYKDD